MPTVKEKVKPLVDVCTHCGRFRAGGIWFHGVDTGEALKVFTVCSQCQDSND